MKHLKMSNNPLRYRCGEKPCRIWVFNKFGLEVFIDAEDYTWDEAQEYLDQGEAVVKDFVKEKFGLGYLNW